ncbi:MAG: non-homologous end-joining DNA ligase [Bacillota bacterium]
MEKVLCEVNEHSLELTNLEKVFWSEEGYTKADLLEYYAQVAPWLLPHLRHRPMVMSRYPDGIKGKTFYQKDCPDYAPDWLPTVPVYSESTKKVINYCLCNDLDSLLWLVNQGCIEMHPWLSPYFEPEYPEAAIFDLDPSAPADFTDVLEIASMVHDALEVFGLQGYPKTSGATGIHIYVPIERRYSYEQVRQATGWMARMIAKAHPAKATTERVVRQRDGKVYLDYLQNSLGKTIASVYSVRPQNGAPVSMPLSWSEVKEGQIRPEQFNISNAVQSGKERKECFEPVLVIKQSLDQILHAAAE